MNGQQLSMYASPSQIMRDRSEFAEEGIQKGRSVLIFRSSFGAILLTESRYNSLYKLGEIYDMLCFAATGRYNEFEPLRVAGIRMADIHGYNYSREDVNGKMVADMYSNILASAFSNLSAKPLEIELGIVELVNGRTNIYSLKYDGTIVESLGSVHLIGIKNENREVFEKLKQNDYSNASVKDLLKEGMKVLDIKSIENVESLLMTHEKNRNNRHIERLTKGKIRELMG